MVCFFENNLFCTRSEKKRKFNKKNRFPFEWCFNKFRQKKERTLLLRQIDDTVAYSPTLRCNTLLQHKLYNINSLLNHFPNILKKLKNKRRISIFRLIFLNPRPPFSNFFLHLSERLFALFVRFGFGGCVIWFFIQFNIIL